LLCPPGTTDPTPFLYNTGMYGAAGVLCLAAISTSLIKPVDPKFHIKEPIDVAAKVLK